MDVNHLCPQVSTKYLSECECLDDDNSSVLHKAAEDLVQPFLHHHRSREVRTLTACCIADVFRIFYPDPPYDDDQMKVWMKVATSHQLQYDGFPFHSLCFPCLSVSCKGWRNHHSQPSNTASSSLRWGFMYMYDFVRMHHVYSVHIEHTCTSVSCEALWVYTHLWFSVFVLWLLFIIRVLQICVYLCFA